MPYDQVHREVLSDRHVSVVAMNVAAMLTRPALPQPPGSCDEDVRAPCEDVRVLDKALCTVSLSTFTKGSPNSTCARGRGQVLHEVLDGHRVSVIAVNAAAMLTRPALPHTLQLRRGRASAMRRSLNSS